MKNATKWTATFAAIVLLAVPQLMFGQVNTTCTTSGNQTNCTSVDQGAQNQRAYEAGQQVGNVIGLLIARGIQSHQFHSAIKNECKQLAPGATWNLQNSLGQSWSGSCPVPKEKKAKADTKQASVPPVIAAVRVTGTAPAKAGVEIKPSEVTNADMAKLSLEDKTMVAALQFMEKHPEFVKCPENSNKMTAFMRDNVKGDSPTEADFEQAFAVLRPSLILH